MGRLAKSRDGRAYSFEETEQDPITVKFPMAQDQFDALSTRQRMQAEQKLNQTGADRSKMILPTQADVNLYQSREGRLLEGGAPEPTFEIEANPVITLTPDALTKAAGSTHRLGINIMSRKPTADNYGNVCPSLFVLK